MLKKVKVFFTPDGKPQSPPSTSFDDHLELPGGTCTPQQQTTPVKAAVHTPQTSGLRIVCTPPEKPCRRPRQLADRLMSRLRETPPSSPPLCSPDVPHSPSMALSVKLPTPTTADTFSSSIDSNRSLSSSFRLSKPSDLPSFLRAKFARPRAMSDVGFCARYLDEFMEVGLLGKGSFGVVYKAVKKLDGQTYAIKRLTRPTSVDHKNREVRAFAICGSGHPNIVRYFNAWLDEDSSLFIQMEYCEGGSLVNQRVGEIWTELELRELMRQMALALAHIHSKGMAHLDVKPDNMYCKLEPDGLVYQLGDFTLTRSIDGDETVDDYEGDGRYLCRSLLNCHQHLQAADIFSLGMTIYELARGSPLPTMGFEWQCLRDGELPALGRLSPFFQQLLRSALDPCPTVRPTAARLAQLLHEDTPRLLETQDASTSTDDVYPAVPSQGTAVVSQSQTALKNITNSPSPVRADGERCIGSPLAAPIDLVSPPPLRIGCGFVVL